jgi:hypothetical protein
VKNAKTLPPGAHSAGVPGTKANAALKGAPVRKPAQIDERFVADPRGGPPLVVSHRGVEVRDNRTKSTR